MSEQTISTRTYSVVCAVLVALTILTVGISFLPLAGRWHLTLGLSIAACKGALVVLVFMHALISPRLIWIVVAVACFWMLILFVLTLTDFASRGQVPSMPGH